MRLFAAMGAATYRPLPDLLDEMRMSLQLLGTNEEAVAEAFAWLHNHPGDEEHRDDTPAT